MTPQPDTLATGVPQLDVLLGGGIVRNSMMLIMGSSGVGKTVLASQIAWMTASHGDPVVVVTAFSEPHHKLIANLERFAFFEREYIGDQIRLINVQHQLVTSLDAAADTIIREAREHNARMVVIDGFHRVRLSVHDPAAPYQFLWDLGAKLHLLGVTTIVMCEVYNTPEASLGEYMLADTVVALSQHVTTQHVQRTLQIVKHRGMHALAGRHTFSLDDTGIRCYPRQETLTSLVDVPVSEQRLSTGLPAFDALLGGGVPQYSSTFVMGTSGAGKSTLGLHYALQGASHNDPVLYVSFGGSIRQLSARAEQLSMGRYGAVERIQFCSYSLANLDPDIVANDVREAVARNEGMRVILDDVHYLVHALHASGRVAGFSESLLHWLQAHHATVWLAAEATWVLEQGMPVSNALVPITDNIIELDYTTTPSATYALTIAKMRLSGHHRAPQLYDIRAAGISFVDTTASAQVDDHI